MSKLILPWIIVLIAASLCMFFVYGRGTQEVSAYSIDQAQFYMQVNNWDSAKIHAVHVLADEASENNISLARTIISLANEHIQAEMEEKAQMKKQAFEHLAVRYHKKDKILWYRDSSSPKFESAPAFYLYLGKRDDKLWMRMRVQYSGTEYLFINQFLIETDTSGYSFVPKEQVQRNHGEKLVWEWMDEAYSEDLYPMFRDIAHSEKAVIRFIGTNSFEERELSVEEKEGLKNVLRAYTLSQD